MAQLSFSGEFMGPGERDTAAYLEAHLPPSWVVICNKELVNPNGDTREIDFIIVATHTVFAVEEKSWSGPIHGNEKGWVLSSGESCPSPLHQANTSAKRIAGMLRNNVPGLQKTLALKHFVLPRVLLSAPDARLFVQDPRTAEQVHRLRGCEQAFRDADRLQASTATIEPFRQQIIDDLIRLANRPHVPRKVGDYEVQAVLPPQASVRCLRAQHRDGTERILKLIPRVRSASQDRQKSLDDVVLREYEALQKLAQAGIAPGADKYFSWDQEQYWVVPLHPIEGRTLRADRIQGIPEPQRVRQLVVAAFEALRRVHEVGVVHRGLTPDRIVLHHDGRVMFSDFQIARLEGHETIASQAQLLDADNPYRAPECRLHLGLAEPTSDVFGLAASLMYWITGFEPTLVSEDDETAEERSWPALATQRPDLPKDVANTINDILQECLTEDYATRPAPKMIVDQLQSVESVSASPRGPLREDDMIENQYEIRRILGQGGTAITYLAFDQVSGTECVLKAITNPERALSLARREFLSLKDLHHPNLPRVYDVRPPASPFHLKLEYVRGSSLRDLREAYQGREADVMRITSEVLQALQYLHERRIIHRDISPANILVPDEEHGKIKLVDFGLATGDEDARSVVGTPPYRPPEVEAGAGWQDTSDLYSLGVVAFELLTGRLPYLVEGNHRRKAHLVLPTAEERQRFPSRLLDILLRASAPIPSDRFQNPEDFRQALEHATTVPAVPPPGGKDQINPFVDELRRAFRNSRLGNRNNRDLDSDFARETYIPTALDRQLLPAILDHQFRLVVLSGNPGDGKTAFLQRIRAELLAKSASPKVENPAGWHIQLDGWTFAALYDASESHHDHSADDLLGALLEPLEGAEPPQSSFTALVAGNDGRVLDYFDRFGTVRYPWLWNQLAPQLTGQSLLTAQVLLIDLKRRSLTGLDAQDQSLLSGHLDSFTDETRWHMCQGCSARDECPMRLNAMTLRDPNLAPAVRQQLHRMVLATHWRRERRATVRDLRSALAFLITHDLGCRDVHEMRHRAEWPLERTERMYFNAAFDGAGGADVLLDECQELDPSVVPVPRLDRFIHFHRSPDQIALLLDLFAAPTARPAIPLPSSVARLNARLREIKRRYAFEANPRAQLQSMDAPPAADLFPYRHFESFRRVIQLGANDDTLRWLLGAISRADGVPERACRSGLALRITQNSNEDLVIVKRLPLEQFRLRLPHAEAAFIESIPDHVVLQCTEGNVVLEIDLDLWELLGRARDGYLPGPEEQAALREEIRVFKNALLARPAAEVALLEPGERVHVVRVRDNRIVREGSVAG